MADIIIYGPDLSSYVRTARWAAKEKGISHELKPVGEDLEKLHPYKKFPILEHNGFRLWETSAICNYIDNVFDGPDLMPSDQKARAQVDQWVSAIDCYIYRNAITNYSLKYIFAGEDGPDRKVIDETVPKLRKDFTLLNATYGDRDHLVGSSLTLADLFVAPIVATVGNFPEGKEIIGACKNLARAHEKISQREAYKAIQPAPPKG